MANGAWLNKISVDKNIFKNQNQLTTKNMIRFYPDEKWKEIKVHKSLVLRYAVSNYGRFLSFTDKKEDGRLLQGGKVEGYQAHSYRITKKKGIKYKTLFIHKLVAEYFLKKKSDEQIFVLHLDHSRDNNFVENLKWATKPEMIEHSKKSPAVIRGRKKTIQHNINSDGRKLTVTKVMLIKKKILDPKRKTRMKMIAKQF